MRKEGAGRGKAMEELGMEELGMEELGMEELGMEELGMEELGMEELGMEELGMENGPECGCTRGLGMTSMAPLLFTGLCRTSVRGLHAGGLWAS
ncbi:hypothetical protein [Prosthecobacter fluviatilis]|uniref:Uncharacterized protein n=1 Tax=Prosthecobacter fluviatilis TaxID=445931 RepID=A0ABW0KVG6_9BACT